MIPPFLVRLLSRHRGGRKFNLQALAQAYRAIPQQVLADLAEFCGALEPMPTDPIAMQRLAGRRDVWLRITAFRAVREDEVVALQRGEGIADLREKP